MIPEKLREVLNYEGVVSIVTQGMNNVHVVNSWNSYLEITDNNRILVPVGGMHLTEQNLKENDHILMTIGSKEVQGFHSKGTGFLIRAIACISNCGADFEEIKDKFPWARAVLKISPSSITQTL